MLVTRIVITATLSMLALIGQGFRACARAEDVVAITASSNAISLASAKGSDELSPANEVCDCFLSHDAGGCRVGRRRCRPYCEHDCRRRFRLTEFNIYPTFSYLGDQSATYNEFEFASHTNLGFLEMENRTVLNVADLPSTIKLGPTNPADLPATVGVRGNGFGDILSGFFFSPPGGHEQTTHLGVGPVFTFPTASNAILGSEQYTAGPGVHFSTEVERLTAGFFLWQSWGFGEEAGQKKVNQLFGKPFLIYEVTKKWNLV